MATTPPVMPGDVVCSIPADSSSAPVGEPPSYRSVTTEVNSAAHMHDVSHAQSEADTACIEKIGPGLHYSDDTHDKLVEEDVEWKYSKCRCLFSVIIHVGFFACILAIVFIAIFGDADGPLIPACAGIMFLCFLINLCESCCSVTCCEVVDFEDKANLVNNIAKTCAHSPRIIWKAKCYHYERRNQTDRDGSSGQPQTSIENNETRVNSHVLEREFQFNNWMDTSQVAPDFGDSTFMDISFKKSFTFADDTVKTSYLKQKEQFYLMCRVKDTHLEFSEIFDIGVFKEWMLVKKGTFTLETSGTDRPLHVFLFSSLLMCTWIYRYWMYKCSRKFTYTYVKEFIN